MLSTPIIILIKLENKIYQIKLLKNQSVPHTLRNKFGHDSDHTGPYLNLSFCLDK